MHVHNHILQLHLKEKKIKEKKTFTNLDMLCFTAQLVNEKESRKRGKLFMVSNIVPVTVGL